MGNVFIQWSEQDTCGIRILDEQHRAVVAIINSFFFHRDDLDIERILIPTYVTLASFARIHFQTEEKLMEKSGYEGLEDHAEHHLKALQDLGTVERECRKTRDSYRLMNFMKQYWLDHMREYDHRYFDHLSTYFAGKL